MKNRERRRDGGRRKERKEKSNAVGKVRQRFR